MSASEEKPIEIKTSTKDVVIAYYSRSGTTKIAAEALEFLRNNSDRSKVRTRLLELIQTGRIEHF